MEFCNISFNIARLVVYSKEEKYVIIRLCLLFQGFFFTTKYERKIGNILACTRARHNIMFAIMSLNYFISTRNIYRNHFTNSKGHECNTLFIKRQMYLVCLIITIEHTETEHNYYQAKKQQQQ